MRRNLATAVAILGITHVAASQTGQSIELAITGFAYTLPEEPYPKTGNDWFAVVYTASGLTLAKTRIEVGQVPDSCGGSMMQITAPDVEEPLFLVRGLPSLKVGPVSTAFSGQHFVPPSDSVSLRIAPGLGFAFSAEGRFVPVGGGSPEVRIYDYELQMLSERRKQSIARFSILGEEGRPSLLWAGDLDRDGKPDALFNLGGGLASRYTLFLSSAASKDQLVKNVATFSTGAC
jgi:hypothetical protein